METFEDYYIKANAFAFAETTAFGTEYLFGSADSSRKNESAILTLLCVPPKKCGAPTYIWRCDKCGFQWSENKDLDVCKNCHSAFGKYIKRSSDNDGKLAGLEQSLRLIQEEIDKLKRS